ncbi:hypothetical protein ACFQJD_16080 [Haloplanus sp. GCM10025708]|uniref:DUF7554 family protein n=1 Tax=Haloferacaceae TaxID=1644056 RepID=UPI00361984BE
MARAELDVDDLLKVVLVLILVWLVLEILGEVLDVVRGVFSLLPSVIGVALVVLIVLWLLDRI